MIFIPIIFWHIVPKTLKIPLSKEIHDELDDAFIDDEKTEDARSFIWGLLRNLCRDAKIGKMSKTCAYSVVDGTGQLQQKTIKTREIKYKPLPSDPTGIPPDLKDDTIKPWVHKVTDKTWEYLQLFTVYAQLRHNKFVDSAVRRDSDRLKELQDEYEHSKTPSNKQRVDDHREAMKEAAEGREKDKPKCIEQVIYAAIYQPLFQKLTENIDKEFDSENDEMYKKKD